MKKAMLFLAVFGLVSLAWAADDPFIGTWKVNTEKSKMTAPPVSPQTMSFTLKVVPVADGVKWINDYVGDDGKPIHTEWSGKYDGKDYAVTGDPYADMYAVRKVDSNTLVEVDKKGGKEVSTWRMVISKDGRTFTSTGKGKDERGHDFTLILVFDKQ